MDIAVNLVENYLRLTGYLTLSEFEVTRRQKDGSFKTLTDIDVMALRFPGAVYIGDPHEPDECEALMIEDPVLQLEDDCVDVIIGEVKQGPAELNPGIRKHAVLHPMLRRVEWLYDEPLGNVIEGLQSNNVHIADGRGGGRVRTRLVAFGRRSVTRTSSRHCSRCSPSTRKPSGPSSSRSRRRRSCVSCSSRASTSPSERGDALYYPRR